MGVMRLLRNDEKALLEALIEDQPKAARFLRFLQHATVEEMNDGGMGSLRFCSDSNVNRKFGSVLVKRELVDKDGVPISIAVNIDNYGELFELDIWKVDFSPLKQFPSLEK